MAVAVDTRLKHCRCHLSGHTHTHLFFVRSYRAVSEGATSAAPDLAVQPLPQRLQPAVLTQGRRQESPSDLRLRGRRGQRAHLQVWRNHHHHGRQVSRDTVRGV